MYKSINPSKMRRLPKATTLEIICFALEKVFHKWPAHYINSKSCSLVRTICVSDYFCHPFSPHFSDKKRCPKLNLKLEIYVPSQTHKVKFPFSLWLSCEKCQNNYVEWEAWFTTIYRKYFKGSYVLRVMLGTEKAHAYAHAFCCPQPSKIRNSRNKGFLKKIFIK